MATNNEDGDKSNGIVPARPPLELVKPERPPLGAVEFPCEFHWDTREITIVRKEMIRLPIKVRIPMGVLKIIMASLLQQEASHEGAGQAGGLIEKPNNNPRG